MRELLSDQRKSPLQARIQPAEVSLSQILITQQPQAAVVWLIPSLLPFLSRMANEKEFCTLGSTKYCLIKKIPIKCSHHEDTACAMCTPTVNLSLSQIFLFVSVKTLHKCFHCVYSPYLHISCKYCKLSYCFYRMCDAAKMERTLPYHESTNFQRIGFLLIFHCLVPFQRPFNGLVSMTDTISMSPCDDVTFTV